MRPSQRQPDELRSIQFQRQFTPYAEGSVLASYGNTQVICNVSVIEGVPRFLRDSKQGWLTAEYGMLPRATHERTQREASRGKQSGRTAEIQRLIGRSLRAAVNLKLLGQYTLQVDCDVIQADGGTRTTAISGSCVALVDAINYMLDHGLIKKNPFIQMVAAVSVGIHQDQAILDLDYQEDSSAEADMNIVMTEHQQFIEVQGTAEDGSFCRRQFNDMISLAESGIVDILDLQQRTLNAEA